MSINSASNVCGGNAGPTPTAPRRVLSKLLILLMIFGSLQAANSTPASAWPNDSNVTIQGSGNCNWRYGAKMTYAYLEASNGQKGYAYVGNGKYSFRLTNVPKGSGVTVKITWNCGLGRTNNVDRFGVARPAFGTTQTRNLYSCLFCG